MIRKFSGTPEYSGGGGGSKVLPNCPFVFCWEGQGGQSTLRFLTFSIQGPLVIVKHTLAL